MTKINDILAFIIEIVAIFLYAKWAYDIPKTPWQKYVLALIAIIIFALIWGNFFAPRATTPLQGKIRWILEFIIIFTPILQFMGNAPIIPLISAIIIIINLYIQATYGRGF